LHPRPQGSIERILGRRQPVEPLEQVGPGPGLGRADSARRFCKGKGILGIDLQKHASVFGTKVVGVDSTRALQVKRRAHGDELRQVVSLGCQAILDPGPQCGKATIEEVPARQKLHLRPVVVVARPHRADNRQLIDATAHMGKPVAHLNSRLPPLLKTDLRGKDAGLRFVDDIVGDLLADVFEIRRFEHMLVRRFAERLARVDRQFGLGIEGLQMAEATAHHHPDDLPGAGRLVRPAVGGRPLLVRVLGSPRGAVARQKRLEGHAGQAHSGG
jgi:hypothetical protein